MVASWELMRQKQLLVGILHTDVTSIAWSLGLRNLQIPGAVLPVAGMPYDMARNVVCQQALAQGYRNVGFLDSDVIPPRDAFLRLLSHGRPIVSGVYCRRSPPHGVPVLIKNGTWFTALPGAHEDPLVEVDYCGAGCLVISRELLERLPPSRPEFGKHWFDWKVDMAGQVPQGEALSEDFQFCLQAKRKLGVSTWVDTSIRCKHVGLAQADYGSYTPCDANPNT